VSVPLLSLSTCLKRGQRASSLLALDGAGEGGGLEVGDSLLLLWDAEGGPLLGCRLGEAWRPSGRGGGGLLAYCS